MADAVVINLADGDDDDDDDANDAVENEHHEEVRQCTLIISEQMRESSVSNYRPGMKQIDLVLNQCHTVEEALTTARDHATPCERCGMNDADACFWFVTGFHLCMLGQQVQARNSVMRNANVRYYLYGQFVNDEYSYLRGPAEAQCRLPHSPLLH